jgi:hypothetical protein
VLREVRHAVRPQGVPDTEAGDGRHSSGRRQEWVDAEATARPMSKYAHSKYHGMCHRLLANCVISTEHFHNGTPCWDWQAKKVWDRSGELAYGVFTVRINGKIKNRRAHRVSLEFFCGIELGKKHEANHLCERTLCINPLHLERVTRAQNEMYKNRSAPQADLATAYVPESDPVAEVSETPAGADFDIGVKVETEECPF